MGRRKVTYTLYEDDDISGNTVDRKLIARRIRSIAIRKGEKFSDWAAELGVNKSYISNIVAGRQQAAHVRAFIEERLGQKFWSDREAA